MGKMVRRRELTCVRRLKGLDRGRVARCVVLKLMAKKIDDEVKKKQRTG
jgi:hypothetical protein